VACVGDELPLTGEGAVELFEHGIERVGEFPQFVVWSLQGDALGQVLLTGRAGSCGEPVHRSQDASGKDPADDRREDNGRGKRDQRVLQQMRERDVTLVLRALLLGGLDALGKLALVGLGAHKLGLALLHDALRSAAGGSRLAIPRDPQLRH
jgi:hypothetical protein